MNTVNPAWLETLSTIATIATPFLIIMLTAFGWRLRHSMERRSKLEEILRNERIGAYNEILEPFVILLMSEAAWEANPESKRHKKDEYAIQKMLSINYRRQAFQMSLLGNDSVVNAYSRMMQYVYGLVDVGTKAGSNSSHKELIGLLGQFLLEVRKSMGNESTKLSKWNMLEWFISDVNSLKS